jgi:hypothetical protein
LQGTPGVDVIGVDDVISDEVLAVDSKLKLTTNVVGTIL